MKKILGKIWLFAIGMKPDPGLERDNKSDFRGAVIKVIRLLITVRYGVEQDCRDELQAQVIAAQQNFMDLIVAQGHTQITADYAEVMRVTKKRHTQINKFSDAAFLRFLVSVETIHRLCFPKEIQPIFSLPYRSYQPTKPIEPDLKMVLQPDVNLANKFSADIVPFPGKKHAHLTEVK